MAYTMGWRLQVFLVNGADADEADPILVDVKEYAAVDAPGWNANAAAANAFKSERACAVAGLSLVRRVQSGLKINARFVVHGQPCGAPEAGNPDLTADQKKERVYVAADTPNLALLLAIRAANKKAVAAGANQYGRPDYVANDIIPEAEIPAEEAI